MAVVAWTGQYQPASASNPCDIEKFYRPSKLTARLRMRACHDFAGHACMRKQGTFAMSIHVCSPTCEFKIWDHYLAVAWCRYLHLSHEELKPTCI
jgi:hypothetical protein